MTTEGEYLERIRDLSVENAELKEKLLMAREENLVLVASLKEKVSLETKMKQQLEASMETIQKLFDKLRSLKRQYYEMQKNTSNAAWIPPT